MSTITGGMVPASGSAPPQAMTFSNVPTFPKVYVTGGPGAVALSTGGETVILAADITTIGVNGRIFISGGCNLGFGSTLLGTNGARVRLYVDGVLISGSEKHDQSTATLAVTISFDSNPIALFGYVEGLAQGTHTVEFRAIKTGAVSTASITGDRNLFIIEVP